MTKEEIIQMAKPFLWGGNVVEGWRLCKACATLRKTRGQANG